MKKYETPVMDVIIVADDIVVASCANKTPDDEL